jgi:hypothetical protein
MPQTLEEFVRGTPFLEEVERLRAIERAVQAYLESPARDDDYEQLVVDVHSARCQHGGG